jgi:hypothetical protein
VLVVVEDDDVLAAREYDVEVAAVDRLFCPPAVDDTPLLTDHLHREAIDESRRAIGVWLDEGGARLIEPP